MPPIAFTFVMSAFTITLISALYNHQFAKATHNVYTLFIIWKISSHSQADFPQYLPPKTTNKEQN